MFGLKGRDTFNKPTSSIGEIAKSIRKWWIKLFPYILTILILVVVGIIAKVWYTHLYNVDVSDVEKQQYVDKKNKELTFKKEKFDEIKNAILGRSEKYNEERVEYNDIFYPVKSVEIEVEDTE